MEFNNPLFAEIILPLGVAGKFTYFIPEQFRDSIQLGMRVEVSFGRKKHYTGIVVALFQSTNQTKTKPILSLLDEHSLLDATHLQFWEWMSEYYMCTPGEVMNAAMPAVLKVESQQKVLRLLETSEIPVECSDAEYLILEALDIKNQLTIQEIQSLLQEERIIPIIQKMIEKNWISLFDSFEESKSFKKVRWIQLNRKLQEDENKLNEIFLQIQKSKLQTRAVLFYLKSSEKRNQNWIRAIAFQNDAKVSKSIIDKLVHIEIFEEKLLDIFEIPNISSPETNIVLSEEQELAYSKLKVGMMQYGASLLHGVTGSGKTAIYIKAIQEALNQGQQVLYLLPEIALTSQLFKRLKTYFPEHLIEYHSGISDLKKAGVWRAARHQNIVVLGARSSLFIPFGNLGLIILDEEHDGSFKQSEPAPRYSARDAALKLCRISGAKMIMGSATPSIESFMLAQSQKIGFAQLLTRFGSTALPELKMVSLRESNNTAPFHTHFSGVMLDSMRSHLEKKSQIIVFKNRRGYAPVLKCVNCNWEAMCDRCDIHLTLHKIQHKLKCHICNLQRPIPSKCPQCNNSTLLEKGLGTEKIAEELQDIFPSAVIQRMDLENARTRKKQQEIFSEFEAGEIDILVGTQMISKGLDFEKVGLVAIPDMDQLLHYPDFRANERAFQLITQVSGRSGRREIQGQVIVQTYSLNHPVVIDLQKSDFETFYKREIAERQKFNYPPFVRLIKLELLHRQVTVVELAAQNLANALIKEFGKMRILGPAEPVIGRVNNLFVREILIKIERNKEMIEHIKKQTQLEIARLHSQGGFSSVRVICDVDPQ
ncbi:MAG: primosomal protein N' [Saprospiraceae bacterium]|nr:primosomal protein N' [Saprospiraceae bacterium]MBK8153082.1 primosomal protein N' [Saprospiraceae bacterium]